MAFSHLERGAILDEPDDFIRLVVHELEQLSDERRFGYPRGVIHLVELQVFLRKVGILRAIVHLGKPGVHAARVAVA